MNGRVTYYINQCTVINLLLLISLWGYSILLAGSILLCLRCTRKALLLVETQQARIQKAKYVNSHFALLGFDRTLKWPQRLIPELLHCLPCIYDTLVKHPDWVNNTIARPMRGQTLATGTQIGTFTQLVEIVCCIFKG